MIRIMLSRVIPALVAVALLAGCSKSSYEHRRLAEDSQQAKEVAALVQELKEAGEDKLNEYVAAHGASNLTASQMNGLRYSLALIARSDDVKVERVDAFGKQVYRATLILQPQNTTMAMLLVEADNGRLYWAGAN